MYEREIEVGSQDYIVFRLKGHPWTLIHGQRVLSYGLPLNDKDAQALSIWLQTDAIYYWESETSGSIGYYLYNCGNCIEKLSDENGDDEEAEDSGMEQFLWQLANRHQAAPLSKDERYSAIAAFLSHKQAERGNEPDPIDTFFREQDAYVPYLNWQSNFEVDQRVTLRLEGLEREDLERMDYVAQRVNVN